MTEQEKQAIEKRFKLITKYINYDEAIVLGSILGKMFSALDERDREAESLKAELDAWKSSNAINVGEAERLRKALEEIEKNSSIAEQLGDYRRRCCVNYTKLVARQALAGEENQASISPESDQKR